MFRGELKKWAPGLVNFVPAVAYDSCLKYSENVLATWSPHFSPALYCCLKLAVDWSRWGLSLSVFVGIFHGFFTLRDDGMQHKMSPTPKAADKEGRAGESRDTQTARETFIKSKKVTRHSGNT